MNVGIDNVSTSYSNAIIDTQRNSISIPIFPCSKSYQYEHFLYFVIKIGFC